MALVVKDRIKESSSTTGQGTLTLGGAETGFRTFADIGDGNTTYYAIVDGNNFEVGIGTYTASGTTLSRDTVLQTSAGNTTKISCSGAQKVFVTQPADKAVFTDASGNMTVNGDVNIESATPVIYFKDSDGTANNYGATYFDADTMYIYTRNGSSHGKIILTSFNGTGQADRLTVDATGNVGIGTTSPTDYNSGADNLVINSSGHTGMTIVSGALSNGVLYFADGTGSSATRGYVYYNHSTDHMDLGTAGNDCVRIDVEGNVGIGGSPVSTDVGYDTGTLHLRGTNTGSQIHFTTSTSGNTATDGAHISLWNDNNLYYSNLEDTQHRFYVGTTETLNVTNSTVTVDGILNVPNKMIANSSGVLYGHDGSSSFMGLLSQYGGTRALVGSNQCGLGFNNNHDEIYPIQMSNGYAVNNQVELGNSNYRFSKVYGVTGDFQYGIFSWGITFGDGTTMQTAPSAGGISAGKSMVLGLAFG